jgi:feruloyl esterase
MRSLTRFGLGSRLEIFRRNRMNNGFSKRFRFALPFAAALLAASSVSAVAAGPQQLPVVKPVVACEQLAKADLNGAANAKVNIESAAIVDTPKGQFCKVKGHIEPDDGFEVNLPVAQWTQRFLEPGCGGDCGMVRATIPNASSCLPALNGEFAVAANDLGHTAGKNYGEGGWAADPQKRMDMAYRGNHLTAVIAKALMQEYYGQKPRYSYFMGCSDGGREALVEAQRFPEDFDGISAGAPVAVFEIQNSIVKAWESAANSRADGSKILLHDRVSILHSAILAHCPTLSGVDDGLLEDPRACHFDPTWVQCKPDAADTSKCLTAEETAVASKLYDGPVDEHGRHLSIGGFLPGSEPNWQMPESATGGRGPQGASGNMLKYMLRLATPPEDPATLSSRFGFNLDTFNQMAESAPFWNGANTNLRAFQKHGGKLILWHGLADVSVTPWISIAYYQGVQKELGEAATDTLLRLFLLPGVSHCSGGEGFAQVELLTPLMAWTEQQQAPSALMAAKTADQDRRPGSGGPGAPGRPGAAGGPGGTRPPAMPYASPAQAALASRPIYPYPYIARYTGKGDPKDAANYEPVKTVAPVPQFFDTEVDKLIGPDNQKFYHVENNQLVPDKNSH